MTSNWQTVPLASFARRITARNTEGNTNVLTISAQRGLVNQRQYFNKDVASENLAHYYLLHRGDFAYNKSYSDGYPIGAIKRLVRYDKGVVSPLYICFRVEATEQASPDYLVHFFESGLFDTEVRAIAKEGARNHGLLNVKPADFFELPVPLPPTSEQRKIASILSSVDEAITGTQAVLDHIQIVKKAMMAELLTRGLPGQHTRFKQTAIGEVPANWLMTTVGDLGEFMGGNGFRPSDWSREGFPIIRIQNLNGSMDFNYYSGRPDPAWLVEPGELLFAWAGSRGASFGPCIWPGPLGVLNQHIYHISPRPLVRKKFLYYVLRLLTEAVEKKAHGFKDTLVHLRKAELTGWAVALPPLEEQDQIVSLLTAFEERIVVEEESLNALRGTKSALSSALLTGEIRVLSNEAVP